MHRPAVAHGPAVVPIVLVRAGAHPAAAAQSPAVVPIVLEWAGAHPAAAAQASAARPVEAARLAAAVALAGVVRPDPIAPARPRDVVLVVAPAVLAAVPTALAPAAGLRMRTVAKASARVVPRRPVRAAERAPADARPALAGSVVTPATPAGAEGPRIALAAAGSAIQRLAPAHRAGTAVWAARQAPVVDPVPVGPRPRRTARPGDRAASATSGEQNAPGIETARTRPTRHHVRLLVSVGVATSAEVTA
jgi:hypothetical protein